jgi:hypothetical protein
VQRSQQLPPSSEAEPEFTDLHIKTKTSKRLKYYGNFQESFDDILNKMMDVMDGKIRRSVVTKDKGWMRSSTFYHHDVKDY